jgi:hypothetical protein
MGRQIGRFFVLLVCKGAPSSLCFFSMLMPCSIICGTLAPYTEPLPWQWPRIASEGEHHADALQSGAGVILNTLDVRVNESVAVFGAGGIGLCAIAAAHIVGAYPIIVVDLSDDKLAFAQRFGATHGVNAATGDPVQAIHALTDGGVDYAIDAIGAARTAVAELSGGRIHGRSIITYA